MTVQEQLNDKRNKNYQTNVVVLLRNEVTKNPVFSAVMHKFALRERARAQVTLHSLVQTMHNEGFEHDRSEYVEVLKILGKLGIGKPEYDSKNKLIALKEIKITLQSIGLAAVSKSDKLKKLRFQNRFKSLKTKESYTEPPISQDDVKAVHIRYPAQLVVKFGKDEVETFNLPGGLSPKEVGLILSSAYAKTMLIKRK